MPTAAVAAMALLACAYAIVLPERPARRRVGLLVALLCGAIAVGAVERQRQTEQHRQQESVRTSEAELAALRAEVERERAEVAKAVAGLAELRRRLDGLAQQLPPLAGRPPAGPFDTVPAGLAAIDAGLDDLGKQIAALREVAHGRAIDDATAAAMIAYLRPLGPHRVVVSCAAADAEAYSYANRVATILRLAGWAAVGPEVTAIFGTAPAMGIGLYVRPNDPPAAARALIDAFIRFNIPYQSRVPSAQAMPDPDTVELFVGKRP
jgi:hypothetical protein